jgi:hypothetical protein
MLVSLSLVFCLIARLDSCQTVNSAAEDGWSGFAGCMLHGQELATHWLADHPKWRLDRIRCTSGNPPRTDEI